MIKTYKYRIKDRSAKKTLRRLAYAVNQTWNYCVAHQRDVEARYRLGAPKRSWASAFDLQKLTGGTSTELGLLANSIYEVCETFARARDKRRHAPGFRSSFGTRRALGWVPFKAKRDYRLEGNSLVYCGKRYRFWIGDRPVPETAKGGHFIEDALGRWWVCFHVEVEATQPAGGEVGIDLGLKDFATLSDGSTVSSPRSYRAIEAKLATAQRAGNKRRAKALQIRAANVRRDFHHKLSTRLSRSYAFIAVGDVNAKALSQTRMAKSVLDAGWSAFRTMLRYKAAQYVEVDEAFTTQTCSSCGSMPETRPRGIAGLGVRTWDCSDCGASHDRDVNAARNILRIARSVPRPVEESRRIAA